jgi:environmental stress-induced protein Ves
LTDFEIRPAASHTRMRWANGGGWTTEIIAQPSSAEWTWRLSVADVEVDGPFSVFAGVDRSIALLSGAGFVLKVGGRDEQVIDTRFQPFRFAGDEATTCRLIDGPVQDLNLMTRRNSVSRRLDFVHIAPDSEIDVVDADVVVVVAGHVRVGGDLLGYLDTIRCTSPSRLAVVTTAGDGAVVATATVDHHG